MMKSQKVKNKTAILLVATVFALSNLMFFSAMEISSINVNPQEILSATYSSSQGYANISTQVIIPETSQQSGGSGCNVGGGSQIPQQQKQVGCGV